VYVCPVNAVTNIAFQEARNVLTPMNTGGSKASEHHFYDAVVVGSGIGGLLAAAQLCKRGKKVAVLERLSFVGGRFTSIDFHGLEVTTGALHMIPHGSRGPFAHMMRSLDIPIHIHDSDVFASFYVDGRHYVCKRLRDVLSFFSLRERFDLLKIGMLMKHVKVLPGEVSFGEWLTRQTDSKKIHNLFEKWVNFGTGVTSDALSYNEARRIAKSIKQYGPPGVPDGGCKNVVDKLVEQIRRNGGKILPGVEATKIIVQDNILAGVEAEERGNSRFLTLETQMVVSDIGPKETISLLSDDACVKQELAAIERIKGVRGLKTHLLSDVSLIPHKGIMFCLDAARVAGIVQPTNAVPTLAPTGKHLLISYQMVKDPDVESELKIGLKDLAAILGPDFEQNCEVISVGTFYNGWPVNRAIQGQDYTSVSPLSGLFLVGDGCKAPGYIMIEGIAKRVEEALSIIS
jgi:phytoene dehydrogenase-like protein